jgi:hypothetical protein
MTSLSQKKKRDYRAEYQRRIERGTAKGLSLSQARGHPKAKEKSIRKPRPIGDREFQISLKALREGKTLQEAAASIRVSPERLRNQAVSLGIIRRQGRKWKVKATLPRKMLIYSQGEGYAVTVGTFPNASKIGRYMAAVKRFLRSNDLLHLKLFIGKSIKDTKGKTHIFETQPNAIYRISSSGGESFEQIYRIVI